MLLLPLCAMSPGLIILEAYDVVTPKELTNGFGMP